MSPVVAGLTGGWKLFQVEWIAPSSEGRPAGRPRSLVHGFPADGRTGILLPGKQRTTCYPLDAVIVKEEGTKGFNFFTTLEEALAYLPRFKTRGYRLALTQIFYPEDEVHRQPNSKYTLVDRMVIPTDRWEKRRTGKELLPHLFS